MKFTFKKLLLFILISALVPLLVSHASQIYGTLYLASANLNQQYASEIQDKLDTILKNKNDIEELTLEIKSKKNDLSMEVASIDDNENKTISDHKEILNTDEKGMKDLLEQFDDLRAGMKIHKQNNDYSTLLNDMNNLISLQKNKYDLLQKVNLDLDNALGVLK